MKIHTWIVVIVAAATAAGAFAQDTPRPPFEGYLHDEPTYGDDAVVAMLAEVLEETDPRAREQAVLALGQTHNPAAWRFLTGAIDDPDAAVRVTAVIAAVELGGAKGIAMASAALAREETDVKLAALRGLASMQADAATESVLELLEVPSPAVRAEALRTLTMLQTPAPQDRLAPLLQDGSVSVRAAALRNALLHENVYAIADEIRLLAGVPQPAAVRSLAIELLGAKLYAGSQRIIAAAAESENPLLRRGAVRAWHRADQAGRIESFLGDESAMVRLAAVRATGDLKVSAPVKIMGMMLSANDEQMHLAAREALRQIGGQRVHGLALDALRDQLASYQNALAKRDEASAPPAWSHVEPARLTVLYSRNAASAAWLLGELGRRDGAEALLQELERLDVDSSVLGQVAIALAKLDVDEAKSILVGKLELSAKRGGAALAAQMAGKPGPPYSEQTAVALVEAAGIFELSQAAPSLLKIIQTNVGGVRLHRASAAGARALPAVMGERRATAVEAVNEILTAFNAGNGARWYAARSAGILKLEGTEDALLEVLQERRPGPHVMAIAAWAIGQITGEAPTPPAPRLNQGDWIIQKLDIRR